MTLAIHRMRTRVVTAAPVDAPRLAQWQDEFGRLDGADIASRWVAADEYLLIRRLPLHLRWRGDPVAGDVGRAWGQALMQGIEEALASHDGNCVRYGSRRAALADLVYRSALGDTSRQWAWRRMDLIARAAMRSDEVLRAGTAQLLHAPELVWPVLQRLVDGEEATASLTAALRGVPVVDWVRLFEASPRTAGYQRWLAGPPRDRHEPAAQEEAEAALQRSPGAQSLLRWAATRAHFVQRHRAVAAVLVCALTSSAEGLSPATLQLRVAAARRRLAALAPALTPPTPVRPHANAVVATPAPAATTRNAPTPAETQARPGLLPQLPDDASWRDTAFGGALFWLGRIAASGVLDRLLALDAPRPLFLRELALALGVPDDDAVMAAFCGGELPPGDAPPALIAEAASLSFEWEQWLQQAAPDLPPPRVTAVCRRRGRLRVEAGWLELHLPLAQVDTSIRRLALDLDPGWLPWLGCVVRIVYDEA